MLGESRLKTTTRTFLFAYHLPRGFQKFSQEDGQAIQAKR